MSLVDLLAEYGGQTVGQASHDLLKRFDDDELGWNALQEFVTFIREEGLDADNTVPEPKLEVKLEKPKLAKVQVGNFVRHYDGEDIELHANCGTLVYLTGNGELVFEDTTQETSAVVSIEQLLDNCRQARVDYDTACEAYDKQEHEAALSEDPVVN